MNIPGKQPHQEERDLWFLLQIDLLRKGSDGRFHLLNFLFDMFFMLFFSYIL